MIKRIIRVTELNEDERCAKHEAVLASRLAEEISDEVSNLEEISVKEDDEAKPPFQDILAEERRRYNAKQEFVYFIYNDLLGEFLKEREGTYLRKMAIPKRSPDEGNEEDPEESGNEAVDNDETTIGKEETTVADSKKLYLPDENVKITFVNENSYSGRVSRQKMEGHGLYRWRSGSQYKGEFEDNKIQGKGTLEWKDGCWYEGDFRDGYRDGKGTMVNRDYNLLYIGQWSGGHAHGKGYCRYEKGDSYDGDWIMGKPDGFGNRVYPSGARYVGHWKDGLRHGVGTMAWTNGDVYRGEWNQGEIHGYGEYTWNGFFNKGLCWPQEVSYMGDWQKGSRHGRGQLSLNSIGGARYSGKWRKNKKHGYGTIIGNNGAVTEGDPLFENNIMLPALSLKDLPEAEDMRNLKNIDCEDSHESKITNPYSGLCRYLQPSIKDGSDPYRFVAKPAKIPEARATTVLRPEQCPPLSYYVDRLRETETASSSSSSISLISGKCRVCEDKSSCRCLGRLQNEKMADNDSRSLSSPSSSKIKCKTSSSSLDQDSVEHEERLTYNCITVHMPRIRNVYDVYSKIFCRDSPDCRLSMSKLSLWQLWRDCEIDKKAGMSLVQIDHCLAANKFTLTEDPYCPFGRIEIWQLIHSLLEVSWHIYTKNGDIDSKGCPSKLANGLDKFLHRDIYPNFGKSVGILVGPERDLIPLYPVYQLYLSVGKLHSARQLLKATFAKKGNNESHVVCQPEPKFLPGGRNAVTVGEKLSYLLSGDEPLLNPKAHLMVKKIEGPSDHSLFALQELGTEDFTHIMSLICPAIKDAETGVIVNMDYQLTFLEFFEILVTAGKKLASKRIMIREADRAKSEAAEVTSTVSSTKDRKTSRSIGRLSRSKAERPRKKLVTKS